LEKYRIFNKKVSKEVFEEVKNKVGKGLPYYLHPKSLTKENIAWLKKNVKQFDQKVLNRILERSVLPDNPKRW
jgi:hypothetical protein